MPEAVLARICLEASERLANLQPTLSHLLFGCGQASSQLAQARLSWGARVHENVIGPMKRVSEATGPNSEMVRSRRQAWRAGGELRSVSERAARAANSLAHSQGYTTDEVQSPDSEATFESLASHGTNSNRKGSGSKLHPTKSILKSTSTPIPQTNHNQSSNSNMLKGSPGGILNVEGNILKTAKATQLNAIKEDLEAESQLFKEKALRELFTFETMSTLECSQALVEMVEISAAYHRTCATILDELAPLLRAELDEQCPLPVYGRSLETHLGVTHAKIAYPLKICIQVLNRDAALCEEGLFRIAGSKTKVDTLKSALNSLRAESVIDQYDYYVIADAMKQYLRSLPQPLLTTHLLNEWTGALQIKDKSVQILRLQQIARKMPLEYERNAGYLFRYLYRLIEHTQQNRMTPASLAIIFGPSLLNPSYSPNSSPQNSEDIPSTSSLDGHPVPGQLNGYSMPAQLAFQGAYKGLIELLIVHANEIFPHLDDDNDSELIDALDDNDDSEEFTQTSISLASEPLTSNTSTRLSSSGGTFSKRAARAMNEITRQSRAFKNLPQRLRSKHGKSTSGRSNTATKTNEIVKSIPMTGRSLTPILMRKSNDLKTSPKLDRTRSLTHEEISTLEEPDTVEDKGNPAFPNRQSPRSILQQKHMEWRRAMLEVSAADSNAEEQKSSIHGDLYDTLFTIQTLNSSKNGVEELLARVRSVYESRSSMGKVTVSTPSQNYATGIAAESDGISVSKPAYRKVFRRHSTSSLSVLDQNISKTCTVATTIQPTQVMKGVIMSSTNYRKKCSTTPGHMNSRALQRVTIPLLAKVDKDRKKRPTSSTGRPLRYSVNDSNLESTASLVTMPSVTSTAEPSITRPTKRTTLPRTGLDANRSSYERRKIISASIPTSTISLEDKLCSPIISDLGQDGSIIN
nr:rho GTPase activating protein 44 [Hymenolepis microstoma]